MVVSLIVHGYSCAAFIYEFQLCMTKLCKVCRQHLNYFNNCHIVANVTAARVLSAEHVMLNKK